MKFDLNKFLTLVNALAPVILVNVPGGEKVAPFVPIIAKGIIAAQQIKGASGPEKRAHVLESLAAGVQVSNQTGKTAIDEHALTTAAGAGIDAVIGAIHAIEGGKVVKP
jgi:hypothetical protein